MTLMSEHGRLGMWVRSNMCESGEQSDPSGASEPSVSGQVGDRSNDSRLLRDERNALVMQGEFYDAASNS